MVINRTTGLISAAAVLAAAATVSGNAADAAAVPLPSSSTRAALATQPAKITLHADQHTVRVWHTVIFTGTGPAGRRVTVQQKVGSGHWQAFPAQSEVRRDGGYRVRVQSGRTGVNYFRVRIDGRYSPSIKLMVVSRSTTLRLGRTQEVGVEQGYGKVRPSLIDNGGDASGVATHVHWRHWGSNVATAEGLTSIFKPKGGYYSKKGKVEFRAQRVRYCPATGSPAYTQLLAREVVKPGSSHFTRWFRWSAETYIC